MTPEFKAFTKNYFKLSAISTLIGTSGIAAWFIYLRYKLKKELEETEEPLEDGDLDLDLVIEDF